MFLRKNVLVEFCLNVFVHHQKTEEIFSITSIFMNEMMYLTYYLLKLYFYRSYKDFKIKKS